MDEAIIIPVIDPEDIIVDVVDGLAREGFHRFVVIDDGSGASSARIFTALEKRGARVLHHPCNRGKGAALKTGMAYAKKAFPDAPAIVTVDGDGQHAPHDVARVCQAAAATPGNIILGTRDFDSAGIPARSKIGNRFSATFFKIDTGVTCPDTQTGLRCIPMGLVDRALACPGDRYDYEMGFLTDTAKSGIPLSFVPIQAIYRDNNSSSHFRPLRDSLLIYRQFLRFAASSAACSIVDLALFFALTLMLALPTASSVAISTVIARLSSGALNFTLNRNFSFSAQGGGIPRQAIRYATLFIAQMFASMILVMLLGSLGLPLVVAKIIADGGLFFASYFIQRNWVFKNEANAVRQQDRKGGYMLKKPSRKRAAGRAGLMPKVFASALAAFTVFVLMDAFVIERVQGQVTTVSFEEIASAASGAASEDSATDAATPSSSASAVASSEKEDETEAASANDVAEAPDASSHSAEANDTEESAQREKPHGKHGSGAPEKRKGFGSIETAEAKEPQEATSDSESAAVSPEDEEAATTSNSSDSAEDSSGLSTASSTDRTYDDGNVKVSISTVRAYDTDIYIADVQVTSAEYLKTAFAQNAYGRNLKETTSDMAEENNAILAINGDYYGFRDDGYVLRNGVLYREQASAGTDALVAYADGTLAAADQDEISAQELAESGAWQVLSFGPTLIEDGAIAVDANDEVDRARASNPRTAIGMISPLHYIVVVSDGRTDSSEGLSLYQLALVMQEAGAEFAYNLDGGGSSTLWFQGETINNPTSGRSNGEREVSDIVYFG